MVFAQCWSGAPLTGPPTGAVIEGAPVLHANNDVASASGRNMNEELTTQQTWLIFASSIAVRGRSKDVMSRLAFSDDQRGCLRVFVVGAPSTRRRALCTVLETMPNVAIAGIGSQLQDVLRKAKSWEVDLVLIDADMPNAFGAVRTLRAACPDVNVRMMKGVARVTPSEAMLAGASGVFELHSAPTSGEILGVGLASGVFVRPMPKSASIRPISRAPIAVQGRREVIAIGASSGGRAALTMVLASLSIAPNVAVLITQHAGTAHAHASVASLKRSTGTNVRIPADGERVAPGGVYLAPTTRHLVVNRVGGGLVFRHDDGPEENGWKPAVDVMFRSMAAACGADCLGVLLANTGIDGSVGARALRDAGAAVVAQDSPGASVIADVVVPLSRLSAEIAKWHAGAIG
jgi:two-component system, chemotaxis family, protein-glutamate methylesterase/glutaminase